MINMTRCFEWVDAGDRGINFSRHSDPHSVEPLYLCSLDDYASHQHAYGTGSTREAAFESALNDAKHRGMLNVARVA